MEGIIRQARFKNPNLDIVMTFFVNESMIRIYQAGRTPLSIEAHAAVASAYGVPVVKPVAHSLPAQPLDPFSYANARFIAPATAKVKSGWTLEIPDWTNL